MCIRDRYYGGQLCPGEISSGELVSLVFYMQSLFDSFNQIGAIYTGMVEAMGAADQVFKWVHRTPGIRPANTALVPASCHGELELRNVSFSYPSRPSHTVLDGLCLHAAPGEVVALCGPSGGGKSSCIALLEHLYEASAGQGLLDGVPVGQIDGAWLHTQVGLVSQEPVLFGRSIRENILYGTDGPVSDEAVHEAARMANAHGFIRGFQAQYDTEVGERGAQLSGGQKQRIAIARALVRRPRVLLLDEATSALDADSEAEVQHAINTMLAQSNMTVLIIAHRLSTIQHADKIVVIQGGKVVEQGVHEELIAREGEYHKLVMKQLKKQRNKSIEQAPGPTHPGAE
eukprot:TRINITY_DN9435_c0_g1_i3.p1 TRINITY_DN9435_c0_g1~~TRINITY_DN9435_c0_g1_i3.p1  ORF type:complete len:344 (+),score=110.26 TRINITY_DN9435_c0_g1_i3:80-1111(+)